jgi:hypothetical protein
VISPLFQHARANRPDAGYALIIKLTIVSSFKEMFVLTDQYYSLYYDSARFTYAGAL